jgi:hypothetical protein
MPARTRACFFLAFGALTTALVFVFVSTLDNRAPAWSHWWCSPSAHVAPTLNADSGPGVLLLGLVKLLAIHWPHFLPLLLGMATVVYLWRANKNYNSSASPNAPHSVTAS